MKGAHNISDSEIVTHKHTYAHIHTHLGSYDHMCKKTCGMIVILLAPILEERNLLVHGMLMVVLERNKLANFYTVAH